MRKLLPAFLTLLLVPIQTFAQQSIGFSDPDNIQPLLDYRLPEWGYSDLYLDFSTNGTFQKNEFNTQDNSDKDNRYSGRLTPYYIRYRESEPRISTYRVLSTLDYTAIDNKYSDNQKNSSSDFRMILQWNFEEKIYREDSDLFFIGGFSGLFDQNKYRLEVNSIQSNDLDRNNIDRGFLPVLTVGIGFGRLRNVNPMIRSLRMNERWNALNTNESLSEPDIIKAAEHLTRLNGYQQTYDRPEKYFWRDMDDILSADLSALSPFDLLYITDVTRESIGFRREGWEVQATLSLRHNINYSKEENEITGSSSSNLSKNTFLNSQIEGTWSKNLSLKHQIGFSGSFLYAKELSDNVINDYDKTLLAGTNWIYTITDRFLVNTRISYLKIGFESGTPNILSFGSKLDYFIENRFSIFTDFQFVYNWQDDDFNRNGFDLVTIQESQRVINFSAGLRYYLKRGLF